MSYTMDDFRRDYMKEHLPQLTPEEQREIVERLAPEVRLAGLSPEQCLAHLSPEQIRQYLERLGAAGSGQPSRRRRKTK